MAEGQQAGDGCDAMPKYALLQRCRQILQLLLLPGDVSRAAVLQLGNLLQLLPVQAMSVLQRRQRDSFSVIRSPSNGTMSQKKTS